MKTITVALAQLPNETDVEPCVIQMSGSIPDFRSPGTDVWDGWLERADIFYAGQAQAIVDAVLKHLPGATIDRIICKLLEHRVSLMKVPYARAGGS